MLLDEIYLRHASHVSPIFDLFSFYIDLLKSRFPPLIHFFNSFIISLSSSPFLLLKFTENGFLCKFKYSTSTFRFVGYVYYEILSLWLNLKYKLQQYIFHFFPTNYTRQHKKINIEQMYFKRNICYPLGNTSQH